MFACHFLNVITLTFILELEVTVVVQGQLSAVLVLEIRET